MSIMNYTSIEDLMKLKCHNCSKILSVGPVYIEHDGSNTCGRCPIPKNAYCNQIYEQLVSNFSFPCSHKYCFEVIPWKNVINHEMNCLRRPSECINSNCSWIGSRAGLIEHFNIKHAKFYLEEKQKYQLNLTEDQNITFLNKWYTISLKVTVAYNHIEDILTVSVFHVGFDNETVNFSFKVKIESEKGTVLKDVINCVQEDETKNRNNMVTFSRISSIIHDSIAFISFKLIQGMPQKKSKFLQDSKNLECHNCEKDATDGVHVCHTSNAIVCKNCKCSCKKRSKYINIDKYQGEGMDSFFHCPHINCPYAYRRHEIKRHVSECIYRFFKCEKCDFVARFQDLISHCKSQHNAVLTCSFTWSGHISAEKRQVVMITDGYIFYFTRKIEKDSLNYIITFDVKKWH